MRRLVSSTLLFTALLGSARPARAQEASAPTPPAPTGKIATTTAQAATVWVHIDGPSDMELQHDADSMHEEHDWEAACVAPCDRLLSSDSRYRLTGGGRKSTGEFALAAPDGGRERIRVSGGSKAWFILGWIGIGAGTGAAVVGLEVLIAPLVSTYVPGADGRAESNPKAGHPVLGWSLLGAGLAVGIGSTVLMLNHRNTTVTQDVTPAQSASGPTSLLGLDEGGQRDSRDSRFPRATFAPLLSGVF